ncbi:DUF6491 family protein [uncultured Sphingomonas sp.]|uniref:DUF6491 family protein n=1 Tax=uncultured Sphingomonas sp. TaxID=158754 RepID=UPI0026272D27|nr:DUF6491 family protein [uncultured Sphingomonas sp.]
MLRPGLFAALALIASAPAFAAQPKDAKEASVPFVNHGTIDDFRADGDQGVYLRANGFNWYYARLMGPCTQLPFVEHIGVETRGIDTLDRFSTLIVGHQRCQLTSLVKSAPPPSKKKHHKG